MKKLLTAAALALSLVSLNTVVFAAGAGDWPDKPDANACINKGGAPGSDGFCNCFANDAINECNSYFDPGAGVCGASTPVGQPVSSVMAVLMPLTSGQISGHGGVVGFCQNYVTKVSHGAITAGDCEADNGALFASGSYNHLCDGHWGNRT